MTREPLVEDIQDYALNIVDTVRESLLILDPDSRVAAGLLSLADADGLGALKPRHPVQATADCANFRDRVAPNRQRSCQCLQCGHIMPALQT